MSISTGGSPLGPAFRKRRVGRSTYSGFKNPPPLDPRTGHYQPLVEEIEDDMIAVSIIGKDAAATYQQTYNAYLLDGLGQLTSQTVKVLNTTSTDLGSGTIVLADRAISGTYWIREGSSIGSGSSSTASTIDFFVDNFDRADAGDIGELWTNPSSFVLNNKVAESALSRAAGRAIYTLARSGVGFTAKALMLRNSDHDIVARFQLGAVSGQETDSGIIVDFIRHPHPLWNGELRIQIQKPSGSAVVLAQETLQSAPAAADSEITISYEGSILSVVHTDISIVYSAGLIAPTFGLVTAGNSLTNSSFPRCSRIKVWSNEVSEPPDSESGHGTWSVDGGFNYTDKYHVDGGYNPNA